MAVKGNYAKTALYLMVKIIFLSLFLNKAASFPLPVIKRMISAVKEFSSTPSSKPSLVFTSCDLRKRAINNCMR